MNHCIDPRAADELIHQPAADREAREERARVTPGVPEVLSSPESYKRGEMELILRELRNERRGWAHWRVADHGDPANAFQARIVSALSALIVEGEKLQAEIPK